MACDDLLPFLCTSDGVLDALLVWAMFRARFLSATAAPPSGSTGDGAEDLRLLWALVRAGGLSASAAPPFGGLRSLWAFCCSLLLRAIAASRLRLFICTSAACESFILI